MDRNTWLKHYEHAPAVVQDYLLDPQCTAQESVAQTKLAYDNDAWDRVMDVVWETVFLQMPKSQFRERIKQLAGDRKPEDVEKAILFHVILPLADLVAWDVDGRLQELGVPLSDIQGQFRISLRPVSYGAAVRRIAAQAKISLLGEELVRRLRDGFVSYLKGVRTVEQFKEHLLRKQEEGGLGFTPEQAETWLSAMREFMAETQVISEQEYADWLQRMEQEAESRAVVAPTVAVAEGEEALPPAPKGPPSTLDQMVEITRAEIGPLTLDAYLEKRLRNIISTRLRDVRNAIQTRQILNREQKVGGMGLPADQADRMAGIIEKNYGQSRQAIVAEEKGKITTIQEEQKTKIEERRKRESEEHAKWYREKIQATQAEGAGVEQFAAAMKQMAEAKAKGLPPPAAPAGAARVMMQEIVPPVRLTGLTEEIAGYTWAEFRRLSKEPGQAAAKILQKLETLKQESFDRWTEGIEAWRRSPLQQEYLKLVAESFSSGKPVAELVEEKRTTNPDLPSSEEIGAIISLNAKIHF